MTEPSSTGSQGSTGPGSAGQGSAGQGSAGQGGARPGGSRQGRTQQGGTRRGGSAGDSWEQRATGAASEIQRWLIKTSARTMRDEIGGQVKGQVKKAFRGSDSEPGDSWATATTEPPHAADEAPECAWCPVCRAARRISQARSGTDSRGGPRLSDAADVMAAAVRDALSGIDSILSYRPGEAGAPRAREGRPAPAAEPPVDAESPVAAAAPVDAQSPVDAESPPAAEPRVAGSGGDPSERA